MYISSENRIDERKLESEAVHMYLALLPLRKESISHCVVPSLNIFTDSLIISMPKDLMENINHSIITAQTVAAKESC